MANRVRTQQRAIAAGAVMFVCLTIPALGAAPRSPQSAANDYPTAGRVEYVTECVQDNGNDFVNMYKCSCVIDRIADALPYDAFVEQSTFAKYASLGGEGGAEFRVDRARSQSKKFLTLQASAYHACGITPGGH